MVRLEDVWPDVGKVLNGSYQLTPRGRLVIPLPGYHNIRSFMDVQDRVSPLGITVSTLDEYLDACRTIFTGFKEFGAVAFKDQSAYFRTLDYGNPTRSQAEEVFNWFMADALRSASYPDGTKALDDFLFHEFMRMARDLELPVQLHTGHLAGLYGDITKANAVQLADLFLLHRDVRFDLFHANWPYGGELLFLVKSFPNVVLDFCWANVIDPIYCQNLMRQAVSSVPHSKIHGFGSDFGGFGYHPGGGYADRAWAHAQIAGRTLPSRCPTWSMRGILICNTQKTWPAPGFSTIQMNSTDWDWGNSVHGSAGAASVDIYRPDTDKPAPLVVVAHGFSRRRRNMAGWGRHLADEGFVAAVPNLPSWSDQVRNGRFLSDLCAQLCADDSWKEHIDPAAGGPDGLFSRRAGQSAGGGRQSRRVDLGGIGPG